MPYPEKLKSFSRDDYATRVSLSDALGVICRISNPICRNGWPALKEGQADRSYMVKRPSSVIEPSPLYVPPYTRYE